MSLQSGPDRFPNAIDDTIQHVTIVLLLENFSVIEDVLKVSQETVCFTVGSTDVLVVKRNRSRGITTIHFSVENLFNGGHCQDIDYLLLNLDNRHQ